MFDNVLCSSSARFLRYSSNSLSILSDTNVVGVRSPPSYGIVSQYNTIVKWQKETTCIKYL